MKKLWIILIFVLFMSGQALAYVTDRVMVAGTTSNDDAESTVLMKEVTVTIDDALTKAFPCLQVFTRQQLIQQLDDLREEAILGPGGRAWHNNASQEDPKSQSKMTDYAEEKAFQDTIDAKLQKLANSAVAKYLVHVKIQNAGNMGWGVTISGINMKKANLYYHDYQLFKSMEAAVDASKSIAEKLVKGFNQYLSNQRTGIGEICPFTGRVDIYREARREKNQKTDFDSYCNGRSGEWAETEKYTRNVREVWSLERIGNPDTKGGVEATYLEETVREDINDCYVCGPSEIGRHAWNRTVSEIGAINGLSNKSAGESLNRDATIRLHFNDDGTYTMTVKAASETGKKTKNVKETATGICNTFSKNDPPTNTPLKVEFEYTFGPFTGTPYDDKLTGQREVKLKNDDLKEDTVLRIDFELLGFNKK